MLYTVYPLFVSLGCILSGPYGNVIITIIIIHHVVKPNLGHVQIVIVWSLFEEPLECRDGGSFVAVVVIAVVVVLAVGGFCLGGGSTNERRMQGR